VKPNFSTRASCIWDPRGENSDCTFVSAVKWSEKCWQISTLPTLK